MSIRRVSVVSEVMLEGILNENRKDRGVVICHPHPLYGGSMENNVVHAIEKGFFEMGYTTLRFNFRGVGGSEGFYDDGEGETKDTMASLKFLRRELDEKAPIVLAGYSFGAWIAGRTSLIDQWVEALFLVAYPFSRYDTTDLREWKKRIFLVGGERDEISPLHSLMKCYKELTALEKHLKVIPTDHFFWGKEGEITAFIKENFL